MERSARGISDRSVQSFDPGIATTYGAEQTPACRFAPIHQVQERRTFSGNVVILSRPSPRELSPEATA